MLYSARPQIFDNTAAHCETSIKNSQPSALLGTKFTSWERYNQEVTDRLCGVAAAELAACSFSKSTLLQLDNYDLRYCLPGPGGFRVYRHFSTDHIVIRNAAGYQQR